MATTSTAGLFTSSSWLSNAAGTPKSLPAASADSRRVVDSAVISKSSASDLNAGMCACAAQPRSALGDGPYVFASPDFGGQRLHGLGKVCPDLVVGQFAFLEAGVSMRDGELEIEHPRAERGQDFAELGLCRGRPERAGARTDDGHRL